MRRGALRGVVLAAVLLEGCSGPAVLSGYGTVHGANFLPRRAAHPGTDFAEAYGAPVLAAADGEIIVTANRDIGCGKSVLLRHEIREPGGRVTFTRYTVYCHLSAITVDSGRVRRGQQLGAVGTTGNAVGVPHVHFELCSTACPYGHRDGDFRDADDPASYFAGCFDPMKAYPDERLVLTYPVRCA